MTTTIAILSVSAGAGHIRAADAIKLAAERYYPDVNTVHIDAMDLVSKLFRKLYAESYITIIDKQPALWGYLYEKMDRANSKSPIDKIRTQIERLNLHKIKKRLKELNPDHIICTHFLPAQLMSRMKRKNKITCPVWVQVTDYDFHGLWIQQHMTGYFAACEEVSWRMADRGIPRDTIHVTGIPISPVFSDPLDRKICAAEIGTNPDKPTLLMMSGGAGVGGIDVMAERLLKLEGDFQIIALAGKNKRLLEKLHAIADQSPGRLFPVGFTTTIERLMSASDIAISKPGGLTSSECIAMELPMILISTVPGQEERNATFLLEGGAALKAYDSAGLEYRVNTLLKSPALLKTMSKNARRISQLHAARNVLEIVLGR
jgi:processive 1,2-diacylglycerol beta-glucosyltransferase